MMLRFVHLSILYLVSVFIVSGLKVSLENIDDVSHIKSSEAFFKNPVKILSECSKNKTRLIERRSSKYSSKYDHQNIKNDKTKKSDSENFGPKAEIVQSVSILQKENEGKKCYIFKVAAINTENQITHGEEMQKNKLSNKFHYKIAKIEPKKKRRKLIELVKKQKAKVERGKNVILLQDSVAENIIQVDDGHQGKYLSRNVTDGLKDNNANGEMKNDFQQDYFLSSKHKRDLEAFFNHQFRFTRARKMSDTDRQPVAMEEKLFTTAIGSEPADHSPDQIVPMTKNQIQNSTLPSSFNVSESDNVGIVNIAWPLVPGPISCNLDFQLQPSFVARLGEFDYVVSVQLQQNPEGPADHSCTGVIYNPRFIIIAPHCLIDNYGLTVTSTDDLCTIDEMIEVDYIIEHENYDSETRKNDIALIKLKSEIHKRAAVFSKDDGTLDNTLYAVGFGELMWRSFPDKISKLLQKVPVRRYSDVLKEEPGTLHITTSHMDMTGAFRGDFGGALVNFQGELVGLKSKLMKKSTEYEVYTRVRTYLPWIKSMVTLHGSW